MRLPGRRARENTDKAGFLKDGISTASSLKSTEVVGQLSDEKYIIRAKAS